jgi:hypothetical protein
MEIQKIKKIRKWFLYKYIKKEGGDKYGKYRNFAKSKD